jgi:hypothetical protein
MYDIHDFLEDFDAVRVYFDDGTSTTMNVLADESIKDAIVDLCYEQGWDALSVTHYEIVED